MIVLAALTTGLVLWITAWALGHKSFDVFLVVVALLAAAAAARIAAPYVREQLGRE